MVNSFQLVLVLVMDVSKRFFQLLLQNNATYRLYIVLIQSSKSYSKIFQLNCSWSVQFTSPFPLIKTKHTIILGMNFELIHPENCFFSFIVFKSSYLGGIAGLNLQKVQLTFVYSIQLLTPIDIDTHVKNIANPII